MSSWSRELPAGEERPSLLDFGCGCGRVLRHVDPSQWGEIHGVDWNPASLRWCAENLGFASLAVARLEPPLPFAPDQRFDLIYAFSVFTHLPEPLQRAWLAEMVERLRRDGLLLLSTHGDALLDDLDEAERARYLAGELVVRQPSVAGTNVCAAYHPPPALQRLLPSALEIVAHRPEGALGNPPQGLWVLRRVETVGS